VGAGEAAGAAEVEVAATLGGADAAAAAAGMEACTTVAAAEVGYIGVPSEYTMFGSVGREVAGLDVNGERPST